MKNIGTILLLAAGAVLAWLLTRKGTAKPTAASFSTPTGFTLPAQTFPAPANSDASVAALAAALQNKNFGAATLTTPTAMLTLTSSADALKRAAVEKEYNRLSAAGQSGKAAAEYFGDPSGLYDALYGGEASNLYPVLLNQIRQRLKT